MRRCPNGTRRKNGTCVPKTKSTRCKRGSRRKNGECSQRHTMETPFIQRHTMETPFIRQYETKFERF